VVPQPLGARPIGIESLGERSRDGHFGFYSIGANTNVIGHAGKTLALIEAGIACYELTDELDTVGVYDFDGTLTGGYTAHPKRDPKPHELHAVSYTPYAGNKVQYSVIDTDDRARRTVDITVGGSPMMHDFSMTEKYLVFYDLPGTFDVSVAAAMTVPCGMRLSARLMLSALIGRVPIPDPIAARIPSPKPSDRRIPYSWNPRYPARIGVMPRDGADADVRWFDVEPCYVFHPMNAYDDGDTIVLDVVRNPKMFDRDRTGPNEGPPPWTVGRSTSPTGKFANPAFDDRAQEFPRIDERLVGKRHRYGYTPTVLEGVEGDDTLLKHDFVRNCTESRSFGSGKALGEFVFHPSSPDAVEDDGVLMGFVYDRLTDRSELAIIDAQTLHDIASIKLPHRVPAGFHGNWVASTVAGVMVDRLALRLNLQVAQRDRDFEMIAAHCGLRTLAFERE
jgi:carotenoid cleavage oxygenase